MSVDHSDAVGFDRHLNMHVYVCTGHEVMARIALGPKHQRSGAGGVHGGVYSSAIEKVASLGAAEWLGGHGIAVGLSNSTNFLRLTAEGTVTITARPLQQGSSQQLWNVDITDEQDQLIACGQVLLANIGDIEAIG